MFVSVQLVLGGVSCGNQSNCRICILIGECCNGVETLEVLELVEFVELPGEAGMSGISGMTGMSGMPGTTGMSGMPLEGLVARMPGMSLEEFVTHTDGFLEDLLAFYA